MALTSSAERRGANGAGVRPDPLGESERATLLEVARRSIAYGLDAATPLAVDAAAYSARLQHVQACFVTLHIDGALRGCVGTLRAQHALVVEAARAAHAAAFRDPRFPPVTGDEVARLDIHISVLSPPEPMHCSGEGDLIAQLRPGIDGLILSDAGHTGTFLPDVWEKFPDPADFLAQLKQKAGLPADYWSDTLRIERYTTEAFGDGPGEHARSRA